MSYIDRNLLPEESILFRTKKHPIIFFFPIILTIFAVFATQYIQSNPIIEKVVLGPWIIVLIFWGYTGIEYVFSDFAVTNKRIMMREGFFNRHANEMRLTTVSQITIDQSLIGVWFDYGTIVINAFGVTDAFPVIAKPNLFKRYVNEELDKLVK